MKLSSKMNKNYTQISVYVIVTAMIIYVLSLVAKNAPSIIREVLERVSWIVRVIKPVILGFVFAYLLSPLIEFFERHLLKHKYFMKRSKKVRLYSVLITLILIVIALATLISILVYSVTKQIRLANFEDIFYLVETYMDMSAEFFNRVIDSLKDLNIETKEFQDLIGNISSVLVEFITNTFLKTSGSISNLTGVVTTMAFSVIIGVWFMIDGKMMTNYLNKVMYALTSEKFNHRVHSFLHDADEVFSGYIRGQLLDALVMMCLISISLSLIGVKFSVLIGVVAGIGNLIPYLGPIIAYVGTAFVCVINGDIRELIVAIIVLVIIQAIDGNFIGPKLLSSSIEVHPLLVIVSLIFGSAIGGFFGMLLAVPVGALIKMLFVRFIDHEVERKKELKKEA